MVRKITFCVYVVFFVALFLACSSSNHTGPKDWPSNAWETDFPKDYDGDIGFFQHPEHSYGFDRYPVVPKNGADFVAHVSSLKGNDAIVSAKINNNEAVNYDYFVCGENNSRIEDINDSQLESRYAISTERTNVGDSIKVALCRERDDKIQKLQELHVHPYEWKGYDFDVYILGDPNSNEDRHQLLNRDSVVFWNTFGSTFGQAVVKHGELSKRFRTFNKGYVLTRAEGAYEVSCSSGDIGEILDSIFYAAYYAIPDNYDPVYTEYFARNYGGKKRAIVQVAYPTKRFWPLKKGENGKIEICGNPKYDATRYDLELGVLSSDACPTTITKASVFKNNGIWKLRYENGNEVDATASNVNLDCMVFAEKRTSDKVEEVGDDMAITMPLKYGAVKTSTVILPLLEEYNLMKKVAIHELGHAMGLEDLDESPLSCIPEPNAPPNSTTGKVEICIEGSGENNLMHYTANSKDYKLRYRSIKGAYNKDMLVNKQESQWKCLQRIDAKKNCINQEVHLTD